MPIRMVPDKKGKSRRSQPRRTTSSNRRNSGGGFQGGGGGIGNIIGMLLPMLSRNPKILIIVAVIGVGAYFFMGGCEGNAGGDPNSQGGISSLFSTGGEFDQEIYDDAEIFEPLADNKKNPLPEKVDLGEYCPTPGNQGKQGSCVAWASAYGARTILEAQRTGKSPNSVKFSPSYLYNQIAIPNSNCQGSYIQWAMEKMLDQGAAKYNEFPYNPNSCSRTPDAQLMRKASDFKIKGFQRLTVENKGKMHEMLAMKQNLAKGSPIIIGMMVGGSFMQNMMGKEMWIPTDSDYRQSGFGGHAMCVVGYDDYKEGGSFKIMNSWGTDWGKGGFAWIRYTDFKEFNREAYGLYPMGNADHVRQSQFEGSFGLENVEGQRNIPIRIVDDYYFETTSTLKGGDDGTKFKIEFTNNIECYTYVFSKETDGSSSVLFPYDAKHSPYCGITGTRVFPRDYSMQPDEIGTKDEFAIVITKQPLDFDVLNSKINASREKDFEFKIEDGLNALNINLQKNIEFTQNGSVVNYKGKANDNGAIIMVIGVDKN